MPDRPNKPDPRPAANGERERKARGGCPCETCLYFDALDESGEEGCVVNVDEDEAYREQAGMKEREGCPFYRYYDEYKLVRKQN